MSLQQVIGPKTGKKHPQNGEIMAQNAGTRARERGKLGHKLDGWLGWRDGARDLMQMLGKKCTSKRGALLHFLGSPLYFLSHPHPFPNFVLYF